MRKLILMGGREWTSDFEELHAASLRLCAGKQVLSLLLAPEGRGGILGSELRANHFYQGAAREIIGRLGGTVDVHLVTRREDGESPALLAAIESAEWIHLFCMAPEDGMDLLDGARLAGALERAADRGAILSGAAGAAMLLCEQAWSVPQDIADRAKRLWDRAARGGASGEMDLAELAIRPIRCLDLAPPAFLLPHFNLLAPLMTQFLEALRAGGALAKGRPIVCADDGTAVANLSGSWDVWGSGAIRVATGDLDFRTYQAGDSVPLPPPASRAGRPAEARVS